MRAKRSKRYRKIMAQYALPPFSFREPYQVLLDAAFLRACHAFHMPLQKFLENTLHGRCRLFVTRCTLAKIMGEWEKEQRKAVSGVVKKGEGGVGRGRPEFLPPPTEVPLRYCKHNDEETSVGEVECLVDLLTGQPKKGSSSGPGEAKNKHHFVLATAEVGEEERRRAGRGFVDVREAAREVPGVPIVYVKRSVMVLEELSKASLRVKGQGEREKLREGLVGGPVGDVVRNNKRKRGDEDEDEDGGGGGEGKGDGGEGAGLKKRRVVKGAKGPNPLSVKKKKMTKKKMDNEEAQLQPRPQDGVEDGAGGHAESNKVREEGPEVPKAKRRRKHGSRKGDGQEDAEVGTVAGVTAASIALQEVIA